MERNNVPHKVKDKRISTFQSYPTSYINCFPHAVVPQPTHRQVQSLTSHRVNSNTLRMTGHRVKTQDTLLISGITRAVSINYNKYRTIGHQVKTQSTPPINQGQLGIKSRPRIHSYIPANSELPISGLSLTTNMPDTPGWTCKRPLCWLCQMCQCPLCFSRQMGIKSRFKLHFLQI